MRRLSRVVRGVLAAVLTMCAGLASAAEFDGARRVFEREWREIDTKYDGGCKVAVERYLKDLRNVLRYMERQGDEFGVRPTKAEIARFEHERTVPKESPPGTPKLIVEARTRYQDVVAPMDKLREEKRGALVDKYVSHLSRLEARLETESRKADARAVRAEIERATAKLGGDTAGGVGGHTLVLPKMYVRGLSLIYLMSFTQGKRIPDQSGRRRHGQLIGTRPLGGKSGALGFSEYQDVIEVEPIRLSSFWTLVVEASFPLAGKGKQRVLASGGYRQDHVVVDRNGVLGVGSGSFVGSGYNVGKLKGWHRLVAVAKGTRTEFHVDGKLVGRAEGSCRDPLTAIGNSAASGYPWGGGLRAVMLWSRALSREEIIGLPSRLAAE